jgi:hypothetical protein
MLFRGCLGGWKTLLELLRKLLQLVKRTPKEDNESTLQVRVVTMDPFDLMDDFRILPWLAVE